jgi:RimJ/RimL family protein N-acetyltransferase
MSFVTLRHFTLDDIAARTGLLRETRFQANLTDFAVSTADDDLLANQRRTIAEEHHVKQIFTLCGPNDETVGFAWITTIDWRSQSCELSFGVLPKFRGGFGITAVRAALHYLRSELNMQVIINQVLDHNTMLQSAESLAAASRVRCEFDSYTVGQWRTAMFWTDTEDDARIQDLKVAQRRRDLAERIRAKANQAS